MSAGLGQPHLPLCILGTPLALEKMLSKRVKEQEKDLVALRCTVSDLKMTEVAIMMDVVVSSKYCELCVLYLFV